MNLHVLLDEYHLAQAHSMRLVEGLDDAQITWRPHPDSSAIGWHLGHQAAVNHYLVRNLTAAEPSIDRAFDQLFDSATLEPQRGALPPFERIVEFRAAVTGSTERTIRKIADGRVGAPEQLALIAHGLLVAVINHEYQHDAWIAEVRTEIGAPVELPAPSGRCEVVDGYLVLPAGAA